MEEIRKKSAGRNQDTQSLMGVQTLPPGGRKEGQRQIKKYERGRKEGQRQIKKYERATGKKGRVIYYDPAKGGQ